MLWVKPSALFKNIFKYGKYLTKKSNILSMDLCHLINTMNEVLLQIKLLNKKADQEVMAFQEGRTKENQ